MLLVLVFWLRFRPNQSSRFRKREADDTSKRQGTSNLGSAQLNNENQKKEKPKRKQLSGFVSVGAPHQILGVDPNATQEEILRAYKERMKQYHPDLLNPSREADRQEMERIAQKLNWAKEELLKKWSKK